MKLYCLFRNPTLFALSSLAAVALASSAHASEVELLGVYQQIAPALVDSTANTTFTPSSGFGAGLQFTANLTRRIGLELGASYGLRNWNDSINGTLQMPAIDLPLGLRLRLFRFLSLDAGGYFSSINAGSRVSYIGTSDYGAYAGAQLSFPLAHKTSFVLGGRYLYGLANVSLAGGNLAFRGYEAVSGLRFNLSSYEQNR